SENSDGKSQMGDDLASGTNGGCPSGISILRAVPHWFAEFPGIVLAKNAAEVHITEGVRRLAFLEPITPSSVFNSTGTLPSTSRSPSLSLTPSEPVRRLTGPLTCIFSKARSA